MTTTRFEHYSDGEYYLNIRGYKVWVLRGDAAFFTKKPGWYWNVYAADDNEVANGGGKYTSFAEAKCEAVNAVPAPVEETS
jgi:hypothetical protein